MSLLIPGTNSIKDTGYNVANSLRFNSAGSDNLNRTPSSASNRRTFTFSTWFKLSGTDGSFISAGTDISNGPLFIIDILSGGNEGILRIEDTISGSNVIGLRTTRLLRDISAWMHLVVAIDTTQSTASDRVKLYINGIQETSFNSSYSTYPSQNLELAINNTHEHRIGTRAANTSGKFFDGYMCETVLIDGQQLDPTSFGEFNEDSPNIWQPKDVSGLTFGTNGFYLDFENSSSLGADVSGNSNNFTVNNLTSVDQSIDTCTNNFPIGNTLLRPHSNITFSDGNLTATEGGSDWGSIISTIGASSGKWYAEVKCTSGAATYFFTGIASEDALMDTAGTAGFAGKFNYGVGYKENGQYRSDPSQGGSYSSYGNSYGDGDIIGIALDLDNSKLYFSKMEHFKIVEFQHQVLQAQEQFL